MYHEQPGTSVCSATKSHLKAEFDLEANCLFQADNSSFMNSIVSLIMEENLSEAGSSTLQKHRLFLDEVSIWEGLVSIFCKVSWDAYV